MTMSSTNPYTVTRKSGTPSRRRNDFLLLVGLLLLVIFGLTGLAAATGWENIIAQISRLNWIQVMGLFALSLLNYTLRSLRWHIFAQKLGIGTTIFQNFRHYLGGFAMTATPARAGELVRMRWLRRETGWRFEKTAPLMLGDRASDLAAMAIILGSAVVLSGSGIVGAIPVALLALGGALVATRPQILAALADTGYRAVKRWPRLFARVRSAARSLAKFSDRRTMSVATIIGVAGWFAEIYAFFLLLGWMGAEIALPTAAAIFIFSTLAGSLVGAPGGVGGTEAAMIALLSLEGIPLETSVPATAIIRFTTLWFAISIGLIVFPIAEHYSKKAADALENN